MAKALKALDRTASVKPAQTSPLCPRYVMGMSAKKPLQVYVCSECSLVAPRKYRVENYRQVLNYHINSRAKRLLAARILCKENDYLDVDL